VDTLLNRVTGVNFPGDGEPFLVLDKPAGIPSGPGPTGPSALDWAIERYPEIASITPAPNRRDRGLIHRLDQDTRGLLLIALTQAAYDFFLEEQRAGRFWKDYRALCTGPTVILPLGFPPYKGSSPVTGKPFVIQSRFRAFGPNGAVVRPVREDGGPASLRKAGDRTYTTKVTLEQEEGGRYRAECCVTEGFRHQVRCHLSWAGYPVLGDQLYGNGEGGEALHFRHPVTGAEVVYELPMRTDGPKAVSTTAPRMLGFARSS
jgi:23S rRNA pseudouridine1911/1915/1917 synthase